MKNFKKELKEFSNFLTKYKFLISIIFIIGIIVYGIKLFSYSISIDTEVIIHSHDGQIRSWLSIGRFSLFVLKKVLMLNPFNPYLANMIMIVCFISSVIFLIYILKKISKDKINSVSIFIFSLIIITSPILAEQFNFTLQAAEVAISMLFLNFAFVFFLKWLKQKNGYISYYQAFVLSRHLDVIKPFYH